MYTIKQEKIYKEEQEECKETYEQNIEFKNTKIDISPILKDVEHCIKSGLEHKLCSFFYDFDTYKTTHDEVLNLTVVKNLTNSNAALHRTISSMVVKHNRNADTYHDSKSNEELEVIVLKRENNYLREELNKYQQKNNVLDSDPINLEIKEKKCNCVCKCNNDISDNVDIINQILMGQNVKNVILKESTKDSVAEAEEEDTEEEEEDTEEEEEEDDEEGEDENTKYEE